MNCKPGDLAVIVKSSCGNEGVIVTCLRLAKELFSVIDPSGSIEFNAATWEVDRDIRDWTGRVGRYVPDSILRPIRDNDGQDETLSWKSVPRPHIMSPKPQKEHT